MLRRVGGTGQPRGIGPAARGRPGPGVWSATKSAVADATRRNLQWFWSWSDRCLVGYRVDGGGAGERCREGLGRVALLAGEGGLGTTEPREVSGGADAVRGAPPEQGRPVMPDQQRRWRRVSAPAASGQATRRSRATVSELKRRAEVAQQPRVVLERAPEPVELGQRPADPRPGRPAGPDRARGAGRACPRPCRRTPARSRPRSGRRAGLRGVGR